MNLSQIPSDFTEEEREFHDFLISRFGPEALFALRDISLGLGISRKSNGLSEEAKNRIISNVLQKIRTEEP